MRPKSGKKRKKSTRPKKTAKKQVKKIVVKRIRKTPSRPEVKALNAAPLSDAAGQAHGRLTGFVVWGFLSFVLLALLGLAVSYYSVNWQPLKMEQASTLITERHTDEVDEDEKISLIATGDVLLARFVEQKMRKLQDYTYPFHNVADFLKNADITFGNLETPLMPGPNTPKGSMTFRADLDSVKGLLFAGYDVLSLANNHAMNYQVSGLRKTMATLKKAGIAYVGAGENQDRAHTPAVLEVKGRKIAFYAYNDPTIPPGFHGEAKANAPGIAKMDIEAVKNDVKNALGSADIVVVSMHAGREYTREPTKFQKDFARAAIDAGASVVIGHHPHWVQPYEFYGDGVIFYSLGNFVFDQFFSEEVKTGLIAKIRLSKGQRPEVEVFPVRNENTQPRLLEGQEADEAIKKMGLQ